MWARSPEGLLFSFFTVDMAANSYYTLNFGTENEVFGRFLGGRNKPMNRRLTKTKVFEANPGSLTEILDFVDEQLDALGIDPHKKNSTRFKLEDGVNDLIQHAADGARIKVGVRKSFHGISVNLSCAGSRIDFRKYMKDVFSGDIDEEAETVILANLLKHYESDIHLSHRNNINRVTLDVSRKKANRLVVSASAMLLGVVAGLVLKTACSQELSMYLANSVFDTGTAFFLRAIKMLISFLVFFSIASGFSGFRDLKELGRVLGVVLGMFVLTAFAAIPVSYGIFNILPAGSEALRFASDSSVQIGAMSTARSTSEMILGILPESFLKAFIDIDMTQLLSIAILTGIAVTRMERYTLEVSSALSAIDELFQKMTLVIVRFMPACIFCSMAKMIIKLDFRAIGSLAGWMGLIYLCDIVIILLLLVMVAVGGKTSPTWYLRQLGSLLPSSYAMASSNAVMPLTIETCRDKLKISPKIYSFAIPLGIIVNKSGSCALLLVSTLFLARVYGVTIAGGALASLFFSVFMLSIAAPAVPGGLLLCLTVLLPELGIPIEGISLLMGLYFLVAMIDTMTNVTSTVSVSYVANKWVKDIIE